ncbi:atrophin-1-like [Eriocheir sinensis]|uniref:atrophin-1-like n=1 Tax=Eriocheir sinensis TaxID=95602 RepID=UPI0021CA259E|nr:atrophin-1-like [Eriocheir sinensis]
MGCVASKPDINDRHANIFQVVNVDEVGHRFSPAKLEVTEADLVLHQRGKAAIRWPLRCLRRYGFDAELFSFESGRRCPTGPGIYAFKCRRAEALFNMLQLQIQNITEDAASRELGTALPILPTMPSLPPHEDPVPGAPEFEGYLDPLQQRPTHPRIPNNVGPPGNSVAAGGAGNMDAVGGAAAYGTSMYRSVGPIHSPVSPPTPLGQPPLPLYDSSYDGLVGAEEPPPTPGHDTRDSLPPSACMNHVDKACPSWTLSQLNHMRRPISHLPPPYPPNQVYVNVGPESRHTYVNMQQKEVSVVPVVPPRQPTAPGSGSSHSGTTTTTDTDHNQQINYIVLEIDHGSDSSVVPPTSPSGSCSPQGMCKGYAQIDFDKTRALNAAKQAAGREDGSRKTRHNSTFSATTPTNLAHHNSSFSD